MKRVVFLAMVATMAQTVHISAANHHDKEDKKHGHGHDKKQCSDSNAHHGAFGSEGTFCDNLTKAITDVGGMCVHNFKKLAADQVKHYQEGNPNFDEHCDKCDMKMINKADSALEKLAISGIDGVIDYCQHCKMPTGLPNPMDIYNSLMK